MRKCLCYATGLLSLAAISGYGIHVWLSQEDSQGSVVVERKTDNLTVFVGDSSYRGQPVTSWSQKIKDGDFTLGGWTASVGIREGSETDVIFADDPRSQGLVPLFVALLRDDNAKVRKTAAVGLGTYGRGNQNAPEVKALLATVADDDDKNVRWFAAHSLRRINAKVTADENKLIEEVYRRDRPQ